MEEERTYHKKKLLIVLGIFLLAVVGITIAYFYTTDTFTNIFNTSDYGADTTEVFTSPENWMPGDTTAKTLTVTNSGNVCENVRVSYTEEWESKDGSLIPNVQNGNSAAIINFSNRLDWVKNGDYYYYNKNLLTNQTTNSFIESVTFNPNIENDYDCIQTGNKRECSSSETGYDDATYTLTIKVETIQCDAAEEEWGVDPTELESPTFEFVNRQSNSTILLGDEVSIGSEHFYVLSSNAEETVLFAKYNLLVGDILDVNNGNYSLNKTLSSSDQGYGLQSSLARGYVDEDNQYIGVVPFSGSKYWASQAGCSIYDATRKTVPPSIDYNSFEANENNYTIAYYVESYVQTLKDMGAPDNIEARLVSRDETADILKCKSLGLYYSQCNSDSSPVWAYSSSYWLDDTKNTQVYYISSDLLLGSEEFYASYLYGVRPVIVVSTSDIDSIAEFEEEEPEDPNGPK